MIAIVGDLLIVSLFMQLTQLYYDIFRLKLQLPLSMCLPLGRLNVFIAYFSCYFQLEDEKQPGNRLTNGLTITVVKPKKKEQEEEEETEEEEEEEEDGTCCYLLVLRSPRAQ